MPPVSMQQLSDLPDSNQDSAPLRQQSQSISSCSSMAKWSRPTTDAPLSPLISSTCFPFVLPVWPSTVLTEGFPRGVIFSRRTIALRSRLHVSHEQGLDPGLFVFPHPGTGISTHGCIGQGFYLQANVVQGYGSLITRYHVAVVLRRIQGHIVELFLVSGNVNMAIPGVVLLTFMSVHLLQFRLGDTKTNSIWATFARQVASRSRVRHSALPVALRRHGLASKNPAALRHTRLTQSGHDLHMSFDTVPTGFEHGRTGRFHRPAAAFCFRGDTCSSPLSCLLGFLPELWPLGMGVIARLARRRTRRKCTIQLFRWTTCRSSTRHNWSPFYEAAIRSVLLRPFVTLHHGHPRFQSVFNGSHEQTTAGHVFACGSF